MNHVQIIGTGLEFIKYGIRSTESVIEEMIQSAKYEIQIMAFVFTSRSIKILQLLEKKAEDGVNITIVINNLNEQEHNIIKLLKYLTVKFSPYVTIIDFNNGSSRQLHAKVVVVDRSTAVIGSANLTWSGMVNNYELGVVVDGSAARKIGSIIDGLVSQPIDSD